MKKLFVSGALLAGLAWLAVMQPAFANADLARSKNCMACHSINNKVVGPGFKEVAKRYAGQSDAEAKLVQKVLKGGSGTWGAVPMPANAQVSEAEARDLVQWILTLK
jgi:cytochrome c